MAERPAERVTALFNATRIVLPDDPSPKRDAHPQRLMRAFHLVEMLGFWVLVGLSEVIGGLLSRAARFVGVAAMSASRAGTLLPRVRSRLLMPVLVVRAPARLLRQSEQPVIGWAVPGRSSTLRLAGSHGQIRPWQRERMAERVGGATHKPPGAN